MAVTITHSTPADGTFSATGAAAWDATHTVSGLGTMAEQNANNVNITGGSITGVTGVLTGLTVNSTPTSGGAAGQIMFDTGSVLQESADLVWDNVNDFLQIKNNAGAYQLGASSDVILTRRGAANLRFGAADAAAPVAQTLSVQSVVAGTSNTAGANLTITGSQGTGTGAGGSIIFQVARAGSTGSAQNALAAALTIASTGVISGGLAGVQNDPLANGSWIIKHPSANAGLSYASAGNTGTTIFNGSGVANVATLVGSVFSVFTLGFSTSPTAFNADVLLNRKAAANLQLGAADAAAPVAQTLSVQSVVAGTTDTAGANLTITGSQSTGTGAAGNIIFQTSSSAASTGTAQNALATVATIGPNTLTGSQATSLLNLAQTWNTTGTPSAIKLNVTDTASNSLSFLMDLQVGGADRFKLVKTGYLAINRINVGANGFSAFNTDANAFAFGGSGRAIMLGNAYNGLLLASTYQISFSNQAPSGDSFNASDTYITRRGAANLRFGAADAAAPVAQTLSVQSVVAGTSNTAGANLTITASQGTGTGAGGDIIFQTALAGASGTAQNTLVTALRIYSNQTVAVGKAYTVATLPAAGTQGRRAWVTDATAPTFLGALIGGGAVVCPVFDNGTAWVAG